MRISKFLTTGAIAAAAAMSAAIVAQAEVKPGEQAPDFTLTDTQGNEHSLSDFKGKFVVLEWLNHECPFVVKHYDSNNMQKLQEKYTGKDVVWLSINSTKEDHRDYKTPEAANTLTKEKGANPTAVLMDASGEVGKKYGAKRTPEMYVINPEGKVVYAGAIDSKKSADKDDVEGATNYVAAALEAAMSGKEPQVTYEKPYGCSIKY